MKTINKNTCHYPAGLDNPEKGNSHFTRYSGQARVGQTKKAFTLVELIIVISILAILATIAFTSFQNFTKDARDGNRVSTIKNIESGLELYTIKTGNYPQPEGEISTGTINDQPLTYKGVIGDTIGKQINMNKTPLDPLTQKNYVYGVTANNKQYQIASVLEGDMAYQHLISTTYASSYYSKVSGNYKGFLTYSSGSGINTETWITNIPSIIYNFTGTTNLLSTTGAYFIINKGKNLPYAPNPQTQINHKTLAETIQEKTNKSEAKIVNMKKSELEKIAKTGTGTLPDGVTSTGELFSSFGIETKESLEVLITGTVTQSSTQLEEPTPTISPYSSGTTYTQGQSFTFDGLIWYVSANNKVAYTKQTPEGNEIPQNLTKDDHILVFDNGQTLTKGTNAFILRTVNQGATQVYNYGTAYQSGATYSGTVVSSDESTRKLYYTADKEMLGNYYQWGRNDPVSLLSTTGSLYNTQGYQTGGINLSGSGFILGPTTPPYSWMNSTKHNATSSVIWTDASNPGPCPTNYRLPTTSSTVGSGEWKRVTELVTGKTASWVQADRQNLQKYLLLPMAGLRNYSTGDFNNQGSNGLYWSSSINGDYGHNLYFNSTGINPSNVSLRAFGFSVRCFKN